MASEVVITADKVKKRRKFGRLLKLSALLLLLFLIVIYIVLKVTYSGGSFSVSLADNESLDSGMAVFESEKDPTPKRRLKAKNVQFMDNISIKWLPENINKEAEGSHNGDNYIAYTFYVENQGNSIFNYWYELSIDDVVKNVDEAIRVMIYINDEKTVYAKTNHLNGKAEKDTVAFNEDYESAILDVRKNMAPGEQDRVTVVIWIEGDDPDCVDALIGGEIKMHMNITEEHINTK